MSTAGNANKRPRRSGGNASPVGPCLMDLPHVLLAHAADYLPVTARALWATALTAPSAAWEESQWRRRPSAAGEAVLGRRGAVTELDFMDVGRDCCKRLSDGDVGAVLECLAARDNLRFLQLTHCVGITGSGLEPLRGSTLLKQIDLSLVEQHESPAIGPVPLIAESAVVPILDSVISAEGSSLAHIQLPKKWREERSEDLHQFLLRYNRFKNEQSVSCSGSDNDENGNEVFCRNTCQGTDEMPWVHFATEHEGYFGKHYYGIQYMTCYGCLRGFCPDCSDPAEPGYYQIDFCTHCEKYYCTGCKPIEFCQALKCTKESPLQNSCCSGCKTLKRCKLCHRESCADCDPMLQCGCSGLYCDGKCAKERTKQCTGRDCNINAICRQCMSEKTCRSCQRIFCNRCLRRDCNKDLVESCLGCVDAKGDAWGVALQQAQETAIRLANGWPTL